MVMVDRFKVNLLQSQNKLPQNTTLQIKLNLITINIPISYQKQSSIL